MPRNNGIYSPPPGTGGTPQTTISSAMFNAWVADITADQNNPRPIIAGGTGSATSQGAIDAFFGAPRTIVDERLLFVDPSDPTKRVRLDAGNVTAGQTRVLRMPDHDLEPLNALGGTMAGDLDMDGNALLNVDWANSDAPSGIPIGAVLFDPLGVGWPGYLEANGSSFDTGVYPDLALLYPSGVLPDFADRVPRGAGPLAGSAGTTQEDAMQRIMGEFGPVWGSNFTTSGALALIANGSNGRPVSGSTTEQRLSLDSGNSPGARVSDDETRVKAIIGKWYIKAYDAFVNAGDVDLIAIEQAQAFMLRMDAQTLAPAVQLQVHENLDTAAEVGKLALGVGQTWQDVTGSRANDTVYQNTTGKPIQVAVQWPNNGGRTLEVSVDGSTGWEIVGNSSANASLFAYALVPPGQHYRTQGGGFNLWKEIRA